MDTRLAEERRGRGEREKKNTSKRAEENMEDKVTMTSNWQDGIK